MYFIAFFFKYYRYHRDLHSFPTRRSSDLARHFSQPGARRAARRRTHHLCLASARAPSDHLALSLRAHTADFLLECERSEEHTSELQSRFDLVCRLLLEKKKSE